LTDLFSPSSIRRPVVPQEQKLAPGDTLRAAMRQENPVIAAIDLLTRPAFEAEPDFNIAERGPKSGLWLNHADKLGRALSEPEFRFIERKIMQEQSDRMTLAQQGAGGVLAAMGAGLMSPTTLIPLVGGARGLTGVAQAFGLALAAAAADEVTLLAAQETRTTGEAAFAIGAGTVLGGLLGSSAVLLRDVHRTRLERALMPDGLEEPPVLHFDGAKVVREGDVEVTPPIKFSEYTPPPEGARSIRTTVRGIVEGYAGSKKWVTLGERSDPAVEIRAQNWLEGGEGVDPALDPSPRVTADLQELHQQIGRKVFEVTPTGEVVRKSNPAEVILTAEQAADEATRRTVFAQEAGPSASTTGAKAKAEPFTQYIEELQPDGTMVRRALADETSPQELGRMASATLLGRIASWTSPVLRSIEQMDAPVVSRVARRVMQRLSDSGVRMEGARAGITIGEGTVESRLRFYDALLARAYRIQLDAYREYLGNGKVMDASGRVKHWAQRETGLVPQGKLTYEEFKEAVSDAMNLGDTHEIPEVAKVAQLWRKEFFEKFNEAADESAAEWGKPRLYQEIEATEESSYFHQAYDPTKIGALRAEFIADVQQFYSSVMGGMFEKRLQKLHKSLEADTRIEEVLLMDRDEAMKLLETVDAEVKMLQMSRSENPVEVEIAELRQARKDLYDEELDRLEAKNTQGFAETTRANQKLAREAVMEPQAAITQKIADLEARLPKGTVEEAERLKGLKKLSRAVKASFGALEEKRAGALKRIEDNEDLNISALKRLIAQGIHLQQKMNRLDDKALDKEIKALDEQIAKLDKTVARSEEKIVKLEASLAPDAPARLDAEAERQLVIEKRLDRKNDQLWAKLSLNRDEAREQLAAKLDAATRYVNDLNSRRAVRNEKLREEVKTRYNPENARAKIAEVKKMREGQIEGIEQSLRDAGATDVDALSSRFNFTETAEEMATYLANKITGNYQRLSQVDMMTDVAMGLRSPMKRRALNLPYEVKRKYLDLDSEQVLGKYANTVGADIELHRAFGDRTAGIAIKEVSDDMDRIYMYLKTREKDVEGKPITDKRRQKDLEKHEVVRRRRMNELNATIDRIRTVRGMPADPTNLGYRLGRTFLNMNVATMMGSAAITSIPEAARVVMAHGLRTAYRDAWEPFLKGLRNEADRKLSAEMIRELRLAGVGIDVLTHQRSKGYFDFTTYDSRQTKFERFWEYAAHKTPTLAGFAQWSDLQKTITGYATMSRILRAADDIATGKAKPADIEYLAEVGISPQWARKIAEQTRKTGTPYKDVFIPNTEAWDDYKALRVFQAALAREDARLVISPGLEKPLWMDEHIVGRVIGQFRSFTMASNTKMLVSGLQQRNMAAFHVLEGATFSLALGMLSYYIWAITNGEKSRKEMREASWETWLDQALYRSGLLGAFSELQALAAEIPATRRFATFADQEVAGRRAESIVGQLLGPSASKIKDIAGVISGIDDPTQSTLNQARKLIPWQNVFYLKEGFRAVTEGTGDLLNLPEKRQ
jgi:hypothetical protein